MQTLISILFRHMEKLNPPDAFYLDLLKAAWPWIAGKYLAKKTYPVSHAGVQLTIRVSDARLLQTMNTTMLSGEIRKKIRSFFPGIQIKRITFQTGKIPAEATAASQPPLPEPPENLPEVILKSADAIQDPDLRQRFLEAAGKGLVVAAEKKSQSVERYKK